MEFPRVRVELLKEQVEFILEVIEKNEPDEELEVNKHTVWWQSRNHFRRALERFENK